MSDDATTQENWDPKTQVVWFDVPCVDLDRAIAFYSAVLDCEVEKQGGGGFFMGVLPHGGTAIGGCLAVLDDTAPSETGVLIYLNCEGRLEDAVAKVEPNGGRVQRPVHAIGTHGSRAIIIDSEGNRVALHSN
jgi:predicted enzyme related to lactoylglutathione lyase